MRSRKSWWTNTARVLFPPWGVGADSKFKLPLGSSAMTLCWGVCRGGGARGWGAADNGSSWEETRLGGCREGGSSLP